MIIITGGAGFIGGAVVRRLNSMGIDDIIIVDVKEAEGRRCLEDMKFKYFISEEEFLQVIDKFKKADYLFHFGAVSSTIEENALLVLYNNYHYPKILAEFAVSNEIKFVYASSAATYGHGKSGFNDDEDLLGLLLPLNLYGFSKHIFDLWIAEKGLFDKVVGLKYFNVFGYDESHKGEMRSFVNKAYEQIISTGEVKLFASCDKDYLDGEQARGFVYIEDAVDMTLFFMNDKYGLYNVGSGRATSFNVLVDTVAKVMGKELVIKYIPMPEHLCSIYQNYTCADIFKIRNAGYNKKLWNLEDSVGDYIGELERTAKW